MGRRDWVGINFCHHKVVELQQQCHMQNAIFDLHPPPPSPPPPPQWFYSLFFWERESANISGDSNRRIGRENEKDNRVRMCFSIITLIFRFFMTLGRHSGFRHGPGETGTTLQNGCFYVVVSQENSGNKVGKW